MSEPIGQTTTTSIIILVLAACPGMEWDGIERTGSASAIGSVWRDKLPSSQAYPRPDWQLLALLLNLPRSSARAV